MISLINNEIRKLLRRKKTFIVFMAFVALMATITISGYKEEQNRIKMNTPEAKIESLQYSKRHLLQEKKINPGNIIKSASTLEDNNKYIEDNIKEIDNQISELEYVKKTGKANVNWKIATKKNMERIEKELNDPNLSNTYREKNKLELKKLNYLLNNNIDPIDENKFNGFNFITILFNEVLGNSLLAIGIILFAADMISGECTPSTLKFLLIQPVSRGKILFSKFIAVILISIGLILPTEFIFFILVGLLVGFGNLNYPVFTGTRYKFDYTNVGFNGNPPLTEVINSTVVIPIWQHTLYMFLLQALFIICCCAFALLISSIFKSSMASMSLGIISVLTITILSQIIPAIRKISYLLFTSYGAVGSLLQGNLALNFNNPSITFPYGLLVLISWVILCCLLSHFIFTKRDILV